MKGYIVILGPDGCGKTTLADAAFHELRRRGTDVHRRDFSFKILPSLSSILRRRTRIEMAPGERHIGMVAPLPKWRAAVLAVWYGIDHMLGRWKIRGSAGAATVVFARSYHDFAYQRAYRDVPKCLVKLFLFLGPRPDLIVVPQQSPELIYARKPELSMIEIEAQYQRIEAFFGRAAGVQFLDARHGEDAAIQSLLGLIGN